MGKPITVIAGVNSSEDKVGTGEYSVLPVSLIYVQYQGQVMMSHDIIGNDVII
jgi:hypothetical protein